MDIMGQKNKKHKCPGVAARITKKKGPEQNEQREGKVLTFRKEMEARLCWRYLDSLTFTLELEQGSGAFLRSKICSCIQIFDKLMFQIWFPVCWGILSLVPP